MPAMILFKTKNNLHKKKKYWILKKWVNEKLIFAFWSWLFNINYRFHHEKNDINLFRHTMKDFMYTVAYAVFIIAIFETYNYILPIEQTILGSETIDVFLATIASISGVFLALYFNAVSGIVSNFLLRASQDIRRYFLETPAGTQYVKTVALTGIISIFYLITKALEYQIHPLVLIFLLLLGTYTITRFWKVGSEVFHSLEPNTSLPHIKKNIIDSITNITPPGFQWNNPSIQNHQRRLVSDNLKLIANLNDFGIRELKLSDEQLIITIRHLGHLLFLYSRCKQKIPTDSFWYKTRNQFESWMLADSTKITLALNTGTILQPKTIKDFTWFEEQTLDIVQKVLLWFVKEKNVGSAFQGLNVFVEVAEVYAKDFDEAGIKLLSKKLEVLSEPIYKIKVEDEDEQLHKELFAFVDTQGCLAITTLLGLRNYLDEQTVGMLLEKINRIDWKSQKSIYMQDLPLTIISDLESLRHKLQNEQAIEGKIVSPKWYIEMLVIRSYVFALQKYFNHIKSLHVDYFQTKLDKLIAIKQLLMAVHLLQHWIEFCNKYQKLVILLKKHSDECASFHKIKDLSWTVFDFESEKKFSHDRGKEVVDKFVKLLLQSDNLTTGDDLPDYFGQALTLGVNACYEALKENDVKRLESILPTVFFGSLIAYDRIQVEIQDWTEKNSKIVYSTEPLINLFEISGYARIYSDLYQSPKLWKIMQQCWDTYLNTIDAKRFITFVDAITVYRDNLFMIMPQETLRWEWKKSFEEKMRESGFPEFPDRNDYINSRKQPNHTSPLIRIIIQWGDSRPMDFIREIFFTTYLSAHTDTQGINLPDKYTLQKYLKHEKQTNKEENYE